MNSLIKIVNKYKMFIIYVVVSLFTSVVNILTYYIVNQFINNIVISNIISYVITLFITFYMNKKYVYKDKGKNYIKKFYTFTLIKLSSLIIDTLVLFLCFKVIGIKELWSKVISNMSTTFNNYFMNKYITFKNEEK